MGTGWQQGINLLNWINWINPILIISGGRLLCKEGPESAGLYISKSSLCNKHFSKLRLPKYQNTFSPFQVPISFCFRLRRNGYLWTLPMSLRNSCIKVQNTFKAFLPWCISISLKYNYSHRESKDRFCLWFSARKHAPKGRGQLKKSIFFRKKS